MKNDYEKMKRWNESRAKTEKEGIEKFWKLKQTFKEIREKHFGNAISVPLSQTKKFFDELAKSDREINETK